MRGALLTILVLVLLLSLAFSSCRGEEAEVYIKTESTFVAVPGPEGPSVGPRQIDNDISEKGESKDLLIGFNAGWPPMTMVLADGEVTGFSIEVVTSVLEKIGQGYVFVPGTWARTRVDLQVGAIDLAPAVSISDERLRTYRFSKAYHTHTHVLFVAADEDEIRGASVEELLETLAGKRIGVGHRAIETEILRRQPEAEIVELDYLTTCFEGLATGLYDGCATVRELGEWIIAENQWPIRRVDVVLGETPLAVAFSMATSQDFIEAFDGGLDALKREGIYEEIMGKWLGPPEGKEEVSTEDLGEEGAAP